MPYPKAEQFEFTLDAIGAPELWVKCQDPQSLPYAEQRRAQQARFILMRAMRGATPDQSEDWAITAMDDVVRKSILAWNLPYPEGHPREGQVIPLSLPRFETDAETGETRLVEEGEVDPLGQVPAPVLAVIVEEVGKRLVKPSKSPPGRG